MIGNKYLLLTFRLVVGGIFIWAGISKIFDPLGFAESIANYRAFSHWMTFFAALVLPWLEMICGVFLVLGFFRRSSALLLSLLLASFLALVAVTLARGINIDCGCFGSVSRKIDVSLMLFDCVLLFLSLNIFFQPPPQRIT